MFSPKQYAILDLGYENVHFGKQQIKPVPIIIIHEHDVAVDVATQTAKYKVVSWWSFATF